MSISLPVSIGEALDKLTILNIKLDNITDERRNDVKYEYDILYEKLKEYVEKFPLHYTMLKDVNEFIYKIQDEIRYNEMSKEQHSNHCIRILDVNDGRFRIKNKINRLVNSQIREQKGYKKTKAFVLCHLGLGDMINIIGAVRYLSIFFDQVDVVCKKKYASNVKLFYQDDDSIQLYEVETDKDISVKYGKPIHEFEKIGINYDTIFLCGYHKLMNVPKVLDIPNSFYLDMRIDPVYRKKYFYVPEVKNHLYDLVKNHAYILVHDESSTLKKRTVSQQVLKSNPDKLVINLNRNLYEKGHPYHEICESFTTCKVLEYKQVIENATELHFIDSSIFCLAMHLNLSNVKRKVCYIRNELTKKLVQEEGFEVVVLYDK